MNRTITACLCSLLASVGLLVGSGRAGAFCGFYISGADATLYNNATQVVLMRDGNRTIQTMQNNYQGPPEDFAMIIPVPVVLMEDNVKIVEDTVFARVDQLTAPRLVEYWEQDPCSFPNNNPNNGDPGGFADAGGDFDDTGVDIEAQFKVGEYDIVILSAEEGSGLETWLTTNSYNIPEGSGPLLDPYVQGGSYFFVAKVDPEKVRFENGRAVLSPLRFWYESAEFNLPIRLGLINASEVQDLLVYILARNQRYDVANYPNVTIPTNIRVHESVRSQFGSFYNALFEETLRQHPGAVVTEYSWAASSCDPCPGPVLDATDMVTLGGDLLGVEAAQDPSWVVTRLHARYGEGQVTDDLVFRRAAPIVGGRQFVVNRETGELERGATPSEFNNFQGRYIILHPWEGEVTCERPYYGVSGGGSSGSAMSPNSNGGEVDRGEGVVLADEVAERVQELNLDPTNPAGNGGRNNTPGGNNGGTNNVGPGPGGNNLNNNLNNGLNNSPDSPDDNNAPAQPGRGAEESGGGCATAPTGLGVPMALVLLGLALGVVALARRR